VPFVNFRAWYKYGEKMLEVVSIHFGREQVYVRILKPINDIYDGELYCISSVELRDNKIVAMYYKARR
jgi:hypothetical protein